MKEILKYSGCFVCGDKNKSGLKARFYYDGEKASATLVASEEFEGYRGLYHGGVLSSLLDEVMIKAILALDRYAVTAEITVRFVAPVKTGDRIILTGKVVRSRGRVFLTEGEARGEDETLFATATAKYIEADPELRKILVQSID